MSAHDFSPEQLGTTPTAAREQIGVRPVDVDALILKTARAYGTTPEAIRGPSRTKHIVAARHAVFAELRLAGWSFPAIGAHLNRDHTTVMAALAKGTPKGERRREQMKVAWARRSA